MAKTKKDGVVETNGIEENLKIAKDNGIILDESDADVIYKIAEGASKSLFDGPRSIGCPPGVLISAVYAFLKSAAVYIGENPPAAGETLSINFADLILLGSDHIEMSEGKVGNITPFISAGQSFKLYSKNDDKTETE